MPDSVLVCADALERLTPELDPASLLSLRHTQASGWGVYASQNLVKGAQLFECSNLSVSVIYRTFRKEACAWCLRYDDGRQWRVHVRASDQNLGAVIFCSDACRDEWRKSVGDVGVAAYAAVEDLVCRHSRKSAWPECGSESPANAAPSADEIENAWMQAEIQAGLIRELRSLSNIPQTKFRGKQMRKAFEAALSTRIYDVDTIYFLLSGILLRPLSSWRRLLMLNPSSDKLYTSHAALDCMVTSYLQLLAILPSPLLQYTTRETLEAIIARDIGNSFGIWSICQPDESPEMLGYGIWPEASFFNHSCAANVRRRRQDRRWIFEVSEDVPLGSELCISYIRGEEEALALDERREKLRSGWGFTCACSKCDYESKQEF